MPALIMLVITFLQTKVLNQCIVYNWNCRNVHIVNYSKMQTTVNCNFSQCDVSIQVFLFITRKVGVCVDQSAVSF